MRTRSPSPCCLSVRTVSTASPVSSVEFGWGWCSSGVREATYLGARARMSAKGLGSGVERPVSDQVVVGAAAEEQSRGAGLPAHRGPRCIRVLGEALRVPTAEVEPVSGVFVGPAGGLHHPVQQMFSTTVRRVHRLPRTSGLWRSWAGIRGRLLDSRRCADSWLGDEMHRRKRRRPRQPTVSQDEP